MKTLALIPARGGSKGVPRKNIKPLGGKALIEYAIELALASDLIDDVIVSTEDSEIAEIAEDAGAETPFLRPAELAGHSSPTVDVMFHCLSYLKKQGRSYDAICLLQPTVPFRKLKDLDGALTVFANQTADSLVSVRPVPHQYNPYWLYIENGQENIITKAIPKAVTRRQNLPKAYYRDGACYISKTKVLLKQKSIYGDTIQKYLMKQGVDINIDTLEDWQRAEKYIELNGEWKYE